MSSRSMWDDASTSAGEWRGVSLVIDTTSYAGAFEREMLAACTGVLSLYPPPDAEEAAQRYDGPDLENVVGRVACHHGEDVDLDRVTIYPTPGWSMASRSIEAYRVTAERPFYDDAFLSVRIPLRKIPDASTLDGIKARARAFAAQRNIEITGFRMIRERTEVQSVAV